MVWEADPSASFVKRLGNGPTDNSFGEEKCPDIWQLDNGDIAVIGRDLTDDYRPRLPGGRHCAPLPTAGRHARTGRAPPGRAGPAGARRLRLSPR